ncbi:MAG: hypothetical protein WCI18_08790 [Pseudomonadota bacterium]
MKNGVLFIFLSLSLSCAHITTWDERAISLKYLNLDDKLETLAPTGDGWELDIAFRHARLELINEEVKRDRPDIVNFLGLSIKSASPAQSDIAVLSSGDLGEYEWLASQTSKGAGQAEKIVAASAAALPVALDQAKTLSVKERWLIGDDGFAVASYMTNSSSPFVILNVRMPSRIDVLKRGYELLEQVLLSASSLFEVCIGRIVIAGFLPQDSILNADQNFLKRVSFKDSATGLCERTKDCSTSNSENEIGMSLYGNTLGQRDERIFFHATTVVTSAQPAFNVGSTAVAKEFPEFGFEAVHPSTRYGWETKFYLPKCN